jgi:hypothetical protein
MKNTQICILCASFVTVMSVLLLQNVDSDIFDQHVFSCDSQYLQEEHCSPSLSHSAEYCMQEAVAEEDHMPDMVQEGAHSSV